MTKREKAVLYNKQWRAKNLERSREMQKQYRAKNIEKLADAQRARRELKLELVAGRPRSGECDICKEIRSTVFDHCHITGKFRGWICVPCNYVLGAVKDLPDRLLELAMYLERHAPLASSRIKKFETVEAAVSAQIPGSIRQWQN